MDYIFLFLSLIFLYLSYKFTLIENAFLALNSIKLKKLEEEETENFELIQKLAKDDELYPTTLVVDYFSNSLCAIFASLFFYEHFKIIGLILGVLISTILIITFGESFPRNYAKKFYGKICPANAKLMSFTIGFLRPLSYLILKISQVFLKLTGSFDINEPLITEEDLYDAMNRGKAEGLLDHNESLMIENVMDFRDSYAKDIMTPRTDIIAIDIESSYSEIIDLICKENFSRMPVYEDNIDNIIGILNVKDLFMMNKHKSLKENKSFFKKPYFTYEYKEVSSLFSDMRAHKISVAIVADEYGGTTGMITIEDLIEKIVGAINDEYDNEDDEDIIKLGPNKYLVDGAMNLDDLNQLTGLELESTEFDSIGGFIIEKIDRFPKKNEVIILDNLKFTVKKTSKNRIDKVLLEIKK